MNLVMPIAIVILILILISFTVFYVRALDSSRRRAVENKKTYFIDMAGSTLGFMLRITCLRCNKTSYHPKDVENKYCGYCHEFHRD